MKETLEVRPPGRPPFSPSKNWLKGELSKATEGSRDLDCAIERFLFDNVRYWNPNDGRMTNLNIPKGGKGRIYTVPNYTTNMMEMRKHFPMHWTYEISRLGKNKVMVVVRNRRNVKVCEVFAKTDELAFAIATIEVR